MTCRCRPTTTATAGPTWASTGARLVSGSWPARRRAPCITTGEPAKADIPVPADYDGDGRADVTVYRGSTGQWHVKLSAYGTGMSVTWGDPSFPDVPVPADYDGDRQVDRAVYRASTGEWFVAKSTGNYIYAQWGSPGSGDLPVVADYDGDGRADIAVYRFSTGEWFILASSNGTGTSYHWGNPSWVDSVRAYRSGGATTRGPAPQPGHSKALDCRVPGFRTACKGR